MRSRECCNSSPSPGTNWKERIRPIGGLWFWIGDSGRRLLKGVKPGKQVARVLEGQRTGHPPTRFTAAGTRLAATAESQQTNCSVARAPRCKAAQQIVPEEGRCILSHSVLRPEQKVSARLLRHNKQPTHRSCSRRHLRHLRHLQPPRRHSRNICGNTIRFCPHTHPLAAPRRNTPPPPRSRCPPWTASPSTSTMRSSIT